MKMPISFYFFVKNDSVSFLTINFSITYNKYDTSYLMEYVEVLMRGNEET